MWVASVPLAVSNNRLFSISSTKEAMVAQIGEWGDDLWSWKFRWRRSLFVYGGRTSKKLNEHLECINLSDEGR